MESFEKKYSSMIREFDTLNVQPIQDRVTAKSLKKSIRDKDVYSYSDEKKLKVIQEFEKRYDIRNVSGEKLEMIDRLDGIIAAIDAKIKLC